MDIDEIKIYLQPNQIQWTAHVLARMTLRRIMPSQIIDALANGKIIEDYPTDYPYPSCLVLGYDVSHKPIHVVCGIGQNKLWIITAYFPNPLEWNSDFTERK